MKIGILHLTDSHIKNADDWILNQFSSVVASIKTIYEECDRIYIVFTGDIAYSGSEEEYVLASKFLNSVRSLLKTMYQDKVFDYIVFTPGNHDCNFKMEKQTRRNAVKSMNYDYIGDDDSVLEQCLVVQKPFWNFVSSINGEDIEASIYKEYVDQIQNEIVVFHAFNTAWMSSINESVGSLFYPVKVIEENIHTQATINISIFHHHQSWLNPNSEENNKLEFSRIINDFSDLIIYGHEHERHSEIHTDLESAKECHIFAGEALQMYQSKKIYSGFQVLIVDLETRKGTNCPFHWNGKIYSQHDVQNFVLKDIGHNSLDFHSKQNFISTLNDMKLPLFFNDDKKIRLKDIFIYPDIEKTNDLKKELYENYVDSSIFINSSNYNVVLLEGENQSGKSSLINMMYLDSISHKKYPLMVSGKSFKKMEVDRPLEKAFLEQYENKSFEEYMQYSNKDKILFVDNLNSAELNNKSILELLNK